MKGKISQIQNFYGFIDVDNKPPFLTSSDDSSSFLRHKNIYVSTTKKQKQQSPHKTQKQEYTIDVETLPHIEAIPLTALERLEVLGDDNTVMRPKHTILFFEMPSFRGSDKSSSQKGGTDVCKELTERNETSLKHDIFTRDLYTCKVDNSSKKLILERAGKQLTSFREGGFNAVFDNDDFDECKGEQYIIRVSILPIVVHTTKGQNTIDQYIKETQLGILAAEAGIGPKIYKIGIMRNVDNLDEVYFYSIIERISGYDVGRMIHKAKYSAQPDSLAKKLSDVTGYYFGTTTSKLPKVELDLSYLNLEPETKLTDTQLS